MNGALLQLQKRSPQDSYLIENPKITFFKTVVKRYINFAIYQTKQDFINPVEWGSNNFLEVSKIGDLVYKMYIVFEIPEITGNDSSYIGRFTDSLGHVLIDEVSVELNSNRVDSHTGEFLEIWSQLTVPESKQRGYKEMIGMSDALCGNYYFKRPATTLYVPLQFWFCRNPGLAFPIKAAARTVMRLLIKFKKFSEVWINTPEVTSFDNIFDDNSGFKLKASVLIDYIFLDQKESVKYTYGVQEYIIEQTQMSLNNSVSLTEIADNNRINFQLTQMNNPVKCLFWVFQKQSNILAPTMNNDYIGNQWTNFSAVSLNPRYTKFTETSHLKEFPNFYPCLLTTNGKSVLNVDVLTYGNYSTLEPTVMKDCTITFDSIERFQRLPAKFFNTVQPYESFRRIPDSTGIYVYSFALNSDSFEPSGVYTFSGLNDIRISFTLNTEITNYKCIWSNVLLGEDLIEETYNSDQTSGILNSANYKVKLRPQESKPSVFDSYVYRNAGYYYESLYESSKNLSTYNLHVYLMNYQILVISNGEACLKFNS